MKIIPPKQTVFFTRATSQSPCLHETLATAAITSASECTRTTSVREQRAKVYCFSEMRAVDFLSISCACKRNVLMET